MNLDSSSSPLFGHSADPLFSPWQCLMHGSLSSAARDPLALFIRRRLRSVCFLRPAN